MLFEKEDVAIEAETADDAGSRGSIDGKAQGTDGDGAVVGDAKCGTLAPNEGPPGAGGSGADDEMVFCEGGGPCGVGSGADFAVELVLVGVGEQGLEKDVGGSDGGDGIGGEDRRETFLPVVVTALDFALCLGSGRVAEADAVEGKRGPKLRQRVGGVSEKEGVIIDVKGQRKTVGEKGGGQEIQVRQKRFGRIKAGCIEPGGVVENIEQDLFFRAAGEEGMRGGIVLPKCAEIADLPAADRLWLALETGIWSELLSDGPTADTGPVGPETKTAKQFAGNGAVGRARRGREQPSRQSRSLRRPGRMMNAARNTRSPRMRAPQSASAEKGSAKFINSGAAKAEFSRHRVHIESARAKLLKQMTEQRGRETTSELWFSSAEGSREMDFTHCLQMPVRASRAAAAKRRERPD